MIMNRTILIKTGLFLVYILLANSIIAQEKINIEGKNYLQFQILESPLNVDKYVEGSTDSLGYTSYLGRNIPNELPSENRMITLRSEFVVDFATEQDELVLVFPPIFYACNIYLNGVKIAMRGNPKNGYASRNHTTEFYLLPSQLLFKNSKNNEIAIELFPKYRENNSVTGIFISSRKIGETYTFWRNLFSVDFIKAMSLTSFVIFLYFFIFSFQRKSEDTKYYIPFALLSLFYTISYLNNIVSFNFADTLVLEKITRFGLAVWTFLTLYYILKFTKITKYANHIIIGFAIVYLPFIIGGWVQNTVYDVIRFSSIYTDPFNIFTDIFTIVIIFIFAFRTRTKYAYIIAFAFFLAIPAIVYDSYYFIVLQSKPYVLLLPYLMFIEIVVFFFIVAWQQSSVYKLALEQAAELKNVNENLEKIVKERTQSLNKFMIAVEQSPTTIVITDTKGCVEYANSKFTELTGYTIEEVKGKKTSVLKSNKTDERVFIDLWQTIQSGKRWKGEFINKKKNGEEFIEIAIISPIFNEHKDIINYIAIKEDITELKKVEHALKESEDKQRKILDTFKDGIYINDSNYKIAYVNSALEKTIGRNPVGESCHKVLYNLDEKCSWCIYPKLKKEKENIEYEYQHKNGITMLVNNIFLENKNKLTIFHDITNLKKTEQALKVSNDTKDKFFSIIAHDLKNPFNAILGFTDILLEEHKEYDDKEREQVIKFVQSSANSAFKLLENLLTWSRSQSGEINYSPEKNHLKILLFETMSNLQAQADKKEIQVLDKTSENDIIFADRNMIATIFRNLISNAIKFTNKSGTIVISSEKQQNSNFVEISVADTGVGIPKDTIKGLFRIDKNTSTQGTEDETGTGLGLILCKEFIEKHGGEIWVESEVGKGSVFKFTIPTH